MFIGRTTVHLSDYVLSCKEFCNVYFFYGGHSVPKMEGFHMTRVKAHFRKTKKGRIKIKAHDRSIKRKRRFKVREGETPTESAKNIFQEKLDAVSINPSMAGKVESALSGPLKNKTGGAIRLRRKKKVRDFLPGGLADGIPDSAFNKVQLRKGIKVELEHTKNKELAKEIAKDHLTEHPDYYKALRKMEDRL